MYATHALLTLFGHDPERASEHAWIGANLLAHYVQSFDVLLTSLKKK